MDNLKPWQLAVVVLGVVGLVGSLVFQLTRGDGVRMAASISAADVLTGELFEAPLPKGRSVSFPAANPVTGTKSLYPASANDGTWRVDNRYLAYMTAWKPEELKGLKNTKTGEVAVLRPTPTRADLFAKPN